MNASDRIERDKQIGLKILEPSQKDLDRGLELHKESIVFDSYGFSPTSVPDSGVLAEATEAGAWPNELQDLTEEMSMTRHLTDAMGLKSYKEAWKASGVTCVFQNAGQEGNRMDRIIKRHARFTHVTDKLGDFVFRAAFPKDIENAKQEGRHCLYFSANGVPVPQRWDTVAEELGFIRIFYQLGCRMMHLTYNRWNMIGVGCGEDSTGGLSDFGREVVREMNQVGVIIDVAHSSLQTSMDAANISEKPMVASHASCWSLKEHCRAKTDEVMRAIFQTGGYMGICCIPSFLGGTGDIVALLDHIDYIVKNFGADYAAIGTDVGYRIQTYDDQPKNVQSQKLRTAFRSLWPEHSFTPEYQQSWQIQSLAWTNWPLFTVGLVQRGHSDDDIRKIIGGNVMRVAKAVLPDKPSFAFS